MVGTLFPLQCTARAKALMLYKALFFGLSSEKKTSAARSVFALRTLGEALVVTCLLLRIVNLPQVQRTTSTDHPP